MTKFVHFSLLLLLGLYLIRVSPCIFGAPDTPSKCKTVGQGIQSAELHPMATLSIHSKMRLRREGLDSHTPSVADLVAAETLSVIHDALMFGGYSQTANVPVTPESPDVTCSLSSVPHPFCVPSVYQF